MRGMAIGVLLALAGLPATALKIDISLPDVEQALVIARSREHERAAFHAKYIQEINAPFLDRAEVVTELRRVVLLAEERAARGDRQFSYSTTRAIDALKVWRRRVSVIARVRFHPQNNYVNVPSVMLELEGNKAALIGVQRDPIYAFPGRKGEFVPVLGALVEGVFEAEALGQAPREFVVSLDGKELARMTFNLAAID
jgi:hypothetical protein